MAPGGDFKLPKLKKHDFLEDKNLLKHTNKFKNYYFLLQCGELLIELRAKVHMDTLGIRWGPQGPPKMAKKWLKIVSLIERNEKKWTRIHQ